MELFHYDYNNPNDPEDVPISNFFYYDREKLKDEWGNWFFEDADGFKRHLNVFAAIDFAATMSAESDYTCIVVAGIDYQHNIFILDIDRFKTDKISVMHERLTKLYIKWRWIKLRGEATAAQNLVVEQIKEFNRNNNIYYGVDVVKPTTQKDIRIMTNLEPRYAAGKILHYRGGNCELLEEELTQKRPRHDDIKDTLASVVEILIPPIKKRSVNKSTPSIKVNSKFGGVAIWQ